MNYIDGDNLDRMIFSTNEKRKVCTVLLHVPAFTCTCMLYNTKLIAVYSYLHSHLFKVCFIASERNCYQNRPWGAVHVHASPQLGGNLPQASKSFGMLV